MGHHEISGLTPAWAGSTFSPASNRSIRWAHPRMGGEHGNAIVPQVAAMGSPPHGRGAPSRVIGAAYDDGLTPAWAGSTSASGMPFTKNRAHPRMGGEHATPRRRDRAGRGSPPHGRGALRGVVRVTPGRGLTPAWAGSTPLIVRSSVPVRAHPRMGGEHRGGGHRWASPWGSPPHGRGAPVHATRRAAGDGLTPAWAGSTSVTGGQGVFLGAHPRMGGEHLLVRVWDVAVHGSPPHGRGAPSATCWFRRMLTECPVLMDCQDALQAAQRTGVHPDQ